MGYFFGGEDFSFIKEMPKSSMMALFFVVVNYFLHRGGKEKK